jgi:hypothetical protein
MYLSVKLAKENGSVGRFSQRRCFLLDFSCYSPVKPTMFEDNVDWCLMANLYSSQFYSPVQPFNRRSRKGVHWFNRCSVLSDNLQVQCLHSLGWLYKHPPRLQFTSLDQQRTSYSFYRVERSLFFISTHFTYLFTQEQED